MYCLSGFLEQNRPPCSRKREIDGGFGILDEKSDPYVFNPSTTLKLHGASNKTDTVFRATRIRSWNFKDFLTNPQAGQGMEPLLELNCFTKN